MLEVARYASDPPGAAHLTVVGVLPRILIPKVPEEVSNLFVVARLEGRGGEIPTQPVPVTLTLADPDGETLALEQDKVELAKTSPDDVLSLNIIAKLATITVKKTGIYTLKMQVGEVHMKRLLIVQVPSQTE